MAYRQQQSFDGSTHELHAPAPYEDQQGYDNGYSEGPSRVRGGAGECFSFISILSRAREREREREGGKGAERGGRTRFFLVGGDHRAKRDKFRKKILLFLFLWGLKGA